MAKKKFQKRPISAKAETMPTRTQKASVEQGNKADQSLANLMSGKVAPSYGKKVTRPTGANKDRRTK